MAIADAIMQEIIKDSATEDSGFPLVKAASLMIGMSIDLGEHFTALKHDIDTTYMAPALIDAADLERVVDTTVDEWVRVTGVVADDATEMVTIYTDNPVVPPVRLANNERVIVLVGDDASKLN